MKPAKKAAKKKHVRHVPPGQKPEPEPEITEKDLEPEVVEIEEKVPEPLDHTSLGERRPEYSTNTPEWNKGYSLGQIAVAIDNLAKAARKFVDYIVDNRIIR